MAYTIYTKPNCPFCVAAKSLLQRKGLQFVEVKIGEDFTRKMLLEILPNAQSVPQIFEGSRYIGGFAELNEHLNRNDPERFLVE